MLDLNYNYLRVFEAVASWQNLTMAAKGLNVSQPSVSLTIHKLEEAIGCRLFDRKSTGMFLTSEGETLHRYVSDAFNILDRGFDALETHGDGEEEVVLRITGSQSLICTRLVPRMVSEFCAEHANCRIRLHGATTIKSIQRLNSGLSDLAIVYSPVDLGAGFRQEVVGETDAMFVGGSAFAHLSGDAVPLDEIARQPLVSYSVSGQGRFFWAEVFGRQGLHPKARYDVNSVEMMLSAVKMNLGIGLMLRQSAELSVARGYIHEIRTDVELPVRKICLVSPKKISNPLTREFLDFAYERVGRYQLDETI